MHTPSTPSRTRPVAAGLVAAAVGLGSLVLLGGRAQATCWEVPIPATTFEPIVVCTQPDETAQGTVAIALQGHARGSGDPRNPAVAVSGTGTSTHALIAISGTGPAGEPHAPDSQEASVISISGTGDASGTALALSGAGDARGIVAISLLGDSRGPVLSVSGTGEARGDTYTGNHPAPFVAVSGCRAEHSDHEDIGNQQILTADPERVHVLVDVEALLSGKAPEDWEPTDVETGQIGQTVQSVTCPL